MSRDHFIISRADAIGDVVLTLPMAYFLKQKFPHALITWIGQSYTKEIILACPFVDNFMDVNHLENVSATEIFHVYPNKVIAKWAYKNKIPSRAGTSHRLFHWFTCNRLKHFSRKNSHLHEAQLNFNLIDHLNISIPSLQELNVLPSLLHPEKTDLPFQINTSKRNIILHPLSRGSGAEWPLSSYKSIIESTADSSFHFYITGTKSEQERMGELLYQLPSHVTDTTSLLSMKQFLYFISLMDGLVASGTGPLHLAATLGINALGLFPSVRPIHPGRWSPIGKKAMFLEAEKNCNVCNKKNSSCNCMSSILPSQVLDVLKNWQ